MCLHVRSTFIGACDFGAVVIVYTHTLHIYTQRKREREYNNWYNIWVGVSWPYMHKKGPFIHVLYVLIRQRV